MSARTDSLAALEHRLGRLFIIGLSISAAALAAGLASYLAFPGAHPPVLLLDLGLIVLMATPLLRVMVSILEYVRLRDWFFVTTTVVVLIELSVTMIYAWMQG
jgi:hypothetical protein